MNSFYMVLFAFCSTLFISASILNSIWSCNLSLVAFKLSKRKPDDNLQILHTILYGKKSKVTFYLGAFHTSSFLLSLGWFESFGNVLSSEFVQFLLIFCFTYYLERCWMYAFFSWQSHSLKKNIGQFSGYVWIENEVFYLTFLMLFCLVISQLFYPSIAVCLFNLLTHVLVSDSLWQRQ